MLAFALEFVIDSRRSFVDRAEDVDLILVPAEDKTSGLGSAETHFPHPALSRIHILVEGLAAADNLSDFLDKPVMLVLEDALGALSIANCSYN